jgi:hypothetical protein
MTIDGSYDGETLKFGNDIVGDITYIVKCDF